MSEEFDSETEVILEVEGTPIKCNKQELIQHSDYFKVMFEGNFIERNKKIIKLEGIDLKAMNIILSLLWDRDNTLLIEKEDDVTLVLQTSSMLQFIEIKTMCMERLRHLLRPANCIKLWLFAEQLDIKPLYLKAKSMALIEFEVVKDSETILELDLKQLHNYMANTRLQCKNELNVFQACMKWWYENSEKISELINAEHLESFRTETFLRLLSCIDFNTLQISDIQEIMMYPDISQNCDVMNILRCIINMRNGTEVDCDKNIFNKAKKLSNSKPRSYKQLPCVVVHGINNEPPHKKLKSSFSDKELIVYHDIFQRKRYYKSIESLESPIVIACYDRRKDGFAKLFAIEKRKCGKLEGFKIIAYKEFIFLFGGEFILGNGNWNKNFWVYDTIREYWERKSVMPFPRRHFQACVCGNYLYIIGGTGQFRVLQDNMFWYNYKEDKWSREIKLPPCGRDIKCLCWKDQLLILNMYNNCGYLFDQCKSLWHAINMGDQQLVTGEHAMFSYKNSIYVKDDNLIEMVIKDQQLVIVKQKPLPLQTVDYTDVLETESVVSGNIAYILYKQVLIDPETTGGGLSLEKFYIDLETNEFIFKDVPDGTAVDIDGIQHVLGPETALFGFQHHELHASDDFVNNF